LLTRSPAVVHGAADPVLAPVDGDGDGAGADEDPAGDDERVIVTVAVGPLEVDDEHAVAVTAAAAATERPSIRRAGTGACILFPLASPTAAERSVPAANILLPRACAAYAQRVLN
jgi:hypothetical protein